jgi:hypothetical protein
VTRFVVCWEGEHALAHLGLAQEAGSPGWRHLPWMRVPGHGRAAEAFERPDLSVARGEVAAARLVSPRNLTQKYVMAA